MEQVGAGIALIIKRDHPDFSEMVDRLTDERLGPVSCVAAVPVSIDGTVPSRRPFLRMYHADRRRKLRFRSARG